MGQFSNRRSIAAWLDAHDGQRVRLTCPGTTLRVIGMTHGVEELDACSTDIFHSELHTGVPGVQLAFSLHDDALALHLLAYGPDSKAAALSLPITIPYGRVRLDPAESPEHSDEAGGEEPDFSPYELLHFPRPD